MLADARLKPEEVEKVFFAGGASFVPAVRRLFEARFGTERLIAADQFESIANGLALIGANPKAESAETMPQE